MSWLRQSMLNGLLPPADSGERIGKRAAVAPGEKTLARRRIQAAVVALLFLAPVAYGAWALLASGRGPGDSSSWLDNT